MQPYLTVNLSAWRMSCVQVVARRIVACRYAWRKKGEYYNAIEDYTTALSCTSNKPRLLNNRAYCWAKLAQYQNAIEDYSSALAAKPDDIHAYHNR